MSIYSVSTAKSIQGISSTGNNQVIQNLVQNIENSTYYGLNAGLLNKGGDNTFMGYYSGVNNLLGSSNVFLGNYTGSNNNSGNQNLFVGTFAGSRNASGNGNTFLGYGAGSKNVNGENNILIGRQNDMIAGSDHGNISMGNFTSFNGSSNIFLGNNIISIYNTSNSILIGNDIVNTENNSVNVGVGTSRLTATSNSISLSSPNVVKVGTNTTVILGDLIVTGNTIMKNVNLVPDISETNFYNALTEIRSTWGLSGYFNNGFGSEVAAAAATTVTEKLAELTASNIFLQQQINDILARMNP